MLSLQLHYYICISRLIIYLSVFNIKRFVNLYIHNGQINSSKLAQLYCKKLSIPSIWRCVLLCVYCSGLVQMCYLCADLHELPNQNSDLVSALLIYSRSFPRRGVLDGWKKVSHWTFHLVSWTRH